MKNDLALAAKSIICGEQLVTPSTVAEVLSLISEAPEKVRASWHPLGFVCLKVACEVQSTLRVHIWPSKERRPQHPAWNIHDHIFDIQSFIICGSITNYRFTVTDTTMRSDPTHRIYKVSYSHAHSYLHRTQNLISCSQVGSTSYTSMSSYSVPRGMFHSSVISDRILAATLVITSNHFKSLPKVLGDVLGAKLYKYRRYPCSQEQVSELIFQVQSEFNASLSVF